eukprot:TRINITY_DN51161_c0_g1_i1.p2 TRINITY_DN51161_c0_g1~~TRINITY_DN51161_c0_g1_i1.p2  ORF type:complete len:195 (-),score=70.07 TRINITY_DN51161_c0_g1_i1:18-602(-)
MAATHTRGGRDSMNKRLIMLALALVAVLALIACSSSDSDSDNPTDPQNPGDSVFAGMQFNDFGADARRVLPPVYQSGKSIDFDIWRDGDYALLGKVFSQDEPMSIHRNIDDHDMIMQEIDMMIQMVDSYVTENDGVLPDEPFAFEHPEYGTGTVDFDFIEPTAAVAVPAVCQTCLLYTSPSPRDRQKSRMPASA